MSSNNKLHPWVKSGLIRALWCVFWIPAGLVFGTAPHGPPIGWFAPVFGFLVFAIWIKEGRIGGDPVGIVRILVPWLIFWLGFLFLPWVSRRLHAGEADEPSEEARDKPNGQ